MYVFGGGDAKYWLNDLDMLNLRKPSSKLQARCSGPNARLRVPRPPDGCSTQQSRMARKSSYLAASPTARISSTISSSWKLVNSILRNSHADLELADRREHATDSARLFLVLSRWLKDLLLRRLRRAQLAERSSRSRRGESALVASENIRGVAAPPLQTYGELSVRENAGVRGQRCGHELQRFVLSTDKRAGPR